MSEAALHSDLSDQSDPSDPSDLSDLPVLSDRFAAARAARQLQIAAARATTVAAPAQSSAFQPSARPSGISKGHYSASSTHRDGPYSPLMRASDEFIAARLARLDAMPEAAFCRPAGRSRGIAHACARTLIEHRLTGERRLYPTSPIGRPIMGLADGGYADGPDTSRARHPGGGPSGRTPTSRLQDQPCAAPSVSSKSSREV